MLKNGPYRTRTPKDRTALGPYAWCHLDGVHGGCLKVQPPAHDMVWRIGERPLLEVRGRDKREIARDGGARYVRLR